MSQRNLFVTTALPYANGAFHIGHIMEYIQADIWVRHGRMSGNRVHFVGADDVHGAPIMIAAQKRGIEAFEVGAVGKDVYNAAAAVIEKAGYGQYFGHGLGHSLGLLIHENPRASRMSEDKFKVGNIITMEPGIYLPGRFGVRIEDMLYLSPSGKVNLTKMPKELLIL